MLVPGQTRRAQSKFPARHARPRGAERARRLRDEDAFVLAALAANEVPRVLQVALLLAPLEQGTETGRDARPGPAPVDRRAYLTFYQYMRKYCSCP
jgi:hypothetical protein